MDIIVISLLTLLPWLCNAGFTDNLAFGAKAVQSSTYDKLANAKHAVDGNRESNYMKRSCTQTAIEKNPWWRVDLKGIYSINKVIITNRGDCCGERIIGAQIRIGNSLDNNGNNNELAATIFTAPLLTETFEFKPIQGRYVNIVLPGTKKYLTLCEVEVYSECSFTQRTLDNIAFGAKAVQSSTYNELADAKHAVDGNKESNYMRGSCTHTAIEKNPWWRVDLRGIYSINKVIITNRGDCCRERIEGAQIRIGNSLDNNGNNNELAATIFTAPLQTEIFEFKPIQGRYVNIFLPGTQKYLTLCEVEVYTGCSFTQRPVDNIAFGANAVQSSTYNELADADHAVDGNRDSDYMKRSCTHTAIEKNPWWRVDLKRIYSINKVIITNRGDCCGERIIGAQIRIGNSLDNNGNNNELAATIFTAPQHTETFEFKPIQGRYVNIVLPGTQKYLTLCEVEVYSGSLFTQETPDNIAFGANAVQSSTYNELADAKHAVDGKRDSNYMRGSCTHTAIENNPWWRVDLKGVYSINKVIITNRGDCCGERIAGAQIRIGNSLDNNGNNNELAATIFTAPQHTETFEFKPIQGRYVNIFLPGTQKYLTLCEVEVYAGSLFTQQTPDNIAFGANAVQSSTYNELADADHAVDGNSESHYMRGSCTHTAIENNPWWRVDLKSIYNINKVIITNRGDCCGERIAGAQIRIGNSLDNNGNNNELAATVGSIPLGGTQTFTFDHIQGQYVNIFLPGNQKILTLCEVEVYAD